MDDGQRLITVTHPKHEVKIKALNWNLWVGAKLDYSTSIYYDTSTIVQHVQSL